jgi:rRNA-processing protein EBP2
MTKKSGSKISAEVESFAKTLQVFPPALDMGDAKVHDDLKRENAFMKQALAAAAQAKVLLAQLGFTFGAPEGYFCEMLKTEEHMNKVQKKTQEELDAFKAAADARKQRQLKKFGKKVQTETLAKRAAQKKEDMSKIAQLRKKRKHAEATDDFDIDFDNEVGPTEKKKIIKGGRKVTVEKKASAKRSYKDSKFGFGGKKWDKKKNTKESTDDFDFNPGKNKKPFSNFAKGGKAGKNKKAGNRPGKQRRQNMRSKSASKRR